MSAKNKVWAVLYTIICPRCRAFGIINKVRHITQCYHITSQVHSIY